MIVSPFSLLPFVSLLEFPYFRYMSVLASELIYNVKNLKAGGIQSDDENLSDRQLYFIINYYRAKLVRQEAQRHNTIQREGIQDLGKVELQRADPHECDCPAEACVLRTVLPIPNSLGLAGRDHGFTFVGMYGGMSWQETTWQAGPWTMFSKYTGDKTKWMIKGRYMYILNPSDPMLSFMNVQGLFDDPMEAEAFRTCDCDDDSCIDDFNFTYPIQGHLIDTLMKMIMDNEMRWSTLIPQDTTNDSLDTN